MARLSKTLETIKKKVPIKTILTTLMAILVSVVVALCLYQDIFILRCIPKTITGYDCPFCGTQRAISYIIHGNFESAFFSNPFLFIVSPYIIVVVLCILKVIPQNSKIQKIAYSKPAIIIAGVATLAWWILRNAEFMKKFLIFAQI